MELTNQLGCNETQAVAWYFKEWLVNKTGRFEDPITLKRDSYTLAIDRGQGHEVAKRIRSLKKDDT